MNKLIFSIIWMLPFIFPIEENSPDPGLIAYYSFNDCDAFDDSGHFSNGQLFGNVGCHCGVEGNGLLFDGIDDYVVFQGDINNYFNTSDFTISFYFRPLGESVFNQSMLSKRTACNEEFMLDILLDQRNMEVITEFHENEYKDYPGISPPLEDGHWYHFALVRKSFRAYTYINGLPMMEGRRCSSVDIYNDTPLSFGNSPCVGSGARRFKGVLDELKVFDQPLSHEEILKLYQLNPVEEAEIDCVS